MTTWFTEAIATETKGRNLTLDIYREIISRQMSRVQFGQTTCVNLCFRKLWPY